MSSIDEEIATLCALLGDDLAAPTTDLVPWEISGASNCWARWKPCWCKATPP